MPEPFAAEGKRKATEKTVALIFDLFLFFGTDDFFAVIVSAVLADLMRFFELMAMRAFHERGRRCLEVRIPCIRSLFRLFRLGNRHLFTPLFYVLSSNFTL